MGKDCIQSFTKGTHVRGGMDWACCIVEGDIQYNDQGRLGELATAFRVEVYAITQAARTLNLKFNNYIMFVIDSQSAVTVIDITIPDPNCL